MSPRAAWRLESLGVRRVHDYAAGKADWLAFGLPHDGHAVFASQALVRDPPTCGIEEALADVRDRLEASPYGFLAAVDAHGVVLGRLQRGAVTAPDDTAVAELMREGPTTVRPSEELEALVQRMAGKGVDALLVTNPDGRLLGVLERAQGERVLQRSRAGRPSDGRDA